MFADISQTIEAESAGNLKRTWVNNGLMFDLWGTRAFLEVRDRGEEFPEGFMGGCGGTSGCVAGQS